jgi:hypothetical protein
LDLILFEALCGEIEAIKAFISLQEFFPGEKGEIHRETARGRFSFLTMKKKYV